MFVHFLNQIEIHVQRQQVQAKQFNTLFAALQQRAFAVRPMMKSSG